MSVPLDSLVGELSLIEGVRQSTTPATGVFTAPRRAAHGRLDDMLYVLIDLLGDVSSADLRALMDQITHAYWSTPGSATSALRAALNAAGHWLMDRNTNAPVPERQTGGVACAVLRGASLYIAQAGPTCVYLSQNRALEQFPPRDAEPLSSIGTARAVDVRFAHAQLQAGDTALLADARASQRLSPDTVRNALTNVTVEQALNNLEHAVGKGDLIALVVQAAPVEGDQPSGSSAASAGAAASKPVGPTQGTPSEPSIPTSSAAADSGPVIHIARRPSAAATSIAASAATTTVAPLPPPTRSVPAPTSPVSAPTPAAPTGGAKPSLSVRLNEWTTAFKQSVRRSVASLGIAGQIAAQRTLPDGTRVKVPARVTQHTTRNQTLLMIGCVIGLALVVALLAGIAYTQRHAQEEMESHVAAAQNEITLAGQAVTGKETRQHWAGAAENAKQALQLDAGNAEAAQLLSQAQTELDKIDNVISLTPNVLWESKSQGQQHLASQGASLFVLDRTANQVNRLILNTAGDKMEGNPDPILVPGMTVNNQTPGNLIDFTSLGSSINRQAADLIVGHEKGLVEYSQQFGPQSLPFGSHTLSPSIKRLRAFTGNLYALDPKAQQILKFEPSGDGYPNPAQNYFKQPLPDLAQADDMAIDGDVYVALNDGRILKFSDAVSATFDVRGLGEPLQRPIVIAVDQNQPESSVYVVDDATDRIVQFRPDGVFIRQFRAAGAAFDGIQDLLVDEQNDRLYVMSKGVLYTVALPPLQ